MISHHSLISVVDDQIASNLDGEAVILHLKSGTYFGLNEVGAHIWNLIQQPKQLSEIQASILATYDVTPEECEQDLEEILQELQQAGLIEVKDAQSS